MMLQVTTATSATDSLLQYGVLGVFAVLLISALVFVFKMYAHQHETQISQLKEQMVSLQKQVEDEKQRGLRLESEFHTYMNNDNKSILTALVKSTDALEGNTVVLSQIKAKLS